MHYKVITAATTKAIEEKVISALAEGWELQGGVSGFAVLQMESVEWSKKEELVAEYTFAQAMIKA